MIYFSIILSSCFDNKIILSRFSIVAYCTSTISSFNNLVNIGIILLVINCSSFLKKGIHFNKIEKIDVFGEKDRFKELEELQLSGNEIKSIDAFGESQCEKLKLLILSKNKIADISILSKAPFKNLVKLELFDNEISDIDVFKNTPFNATLNELDLSFNCLRSSDVLINKQNFKNLNDLKIECNSNLDYKDKKIKELFDNYKKIEYTFNPIFYYSKI